MKNLRYVLLKNPEHLSENQRAQLQFLTEANPRLYRVYLIKEGLRLALKAGPEEIADALHKWIAWAQRCRIPAFRELRLKIKRALLRHRCGSQTRPLQCSCRGYEQQN
ncbi:transposase [Intestinimonas massiliensis (ex Afouda et al. 2020)]|uniref:transposase n=1 Tax=Intestinimonas massiliensis (ex Afouda et al. 2020) TaxID=1673721 RepID=UPI0034A0ABA7